MDVKKKYYKHFGEKPEHSTSTHDAWDVIAFAESLLKVDIMYAIYDKEGQMIPHTIRHSSEQCWSDFEEHTNCHRNLLRTTGKRDYGYTCKQIKILKKD